MGDVSAVTNMGSMFLQASAFNMDLSKWDVSKVTDKTFMFSFATSFNQDLSKWDVSGVLKMLYMFYGATAFKYELCGEAWVNSEADKSDMFTFSPGSIALVECTTTTTDSAAFTPESKEELQDAVNQ